MGAYSVGDIVRLKMLSDDEHYYIITSVLDFTMNGDDEPDVDYEMALIFPVSGEPDIEEMIHSELELMAEYRSRDYELIIDYIINRRVNFGYSSIPKRIEHIILNDGVTRGRGRVEKPSRPTVSKRSVIQNKFGAKEINQILEDTTTADKTDLAVEQMNTHLELLQKAIIDKDEEQINFNKNKLEEVRQTLMELEYFQLAKRREGTSIRVK